MRKKAGILAYRKKNKEIQILIVHPGGPFYEGLNAGYWSFPKGGLNGGETGEQGARREFKEETSKTPPKKLKYLSTSPEYPNCDIFVGEFEGVGVKGMKSNKFEATLEG